MRRFLPLAALLLVAAAPATHPIPGPMPGYVRVRLVTAMGPIVLALDAKHAPRTTANFLTYVDDGRFDDTRFYRAARRKDAAGHDEAGLGFIQGGIDTDARRSLDPVAIERTDRTGIRHVAGTISMAHGPSPDSATGNFSIMVGPTPALDAHGAYAGYAAFGHVIAGMDVVKRILAVPTGGGFDAMKGQLILKPVPLIRAERLDGTPHPSGRFKTWLAFRRQ